MLTWEAKGRGRRRGRHRERGGDIEGGKAVDGGPDRRRGKEQSPKGGHEGAPALGDSECSGCEKTQGWSKARRGALPWPIKQGFLEASRL